MVFQSTVTGLENPETGLSYATPHRINKFVLTSRGTAKYGPNTILDETQKNSQVGKEVT